MKKLFVLLAAVMVSASVASAQDWGIGGRLGNGIQVVGQKYFSNDNYIEARLGMNFIGGIGAEISATYNWNTFNWDWTPGNWFLDFGAGVNISPSKNYLFLGVQGVAKFGYTFENVPLTLSVDYSPALGPAIGFNGYKTGFGWGSIYNSGVSCVYRF